MTKTILVDGYLCSDSHFPFEILKLHVFSIHDMVDDVHLEHIYIVFNISMQFFARRCFHKPGLQCVIFIYKYERAKRMSLHRYAKYKTSILHPPNVVLDFFWLPEFSISVDSWFINIVMIIILSLGFNLKEVVSVCLFLCSVMLSHDVQFRGIKVDTFLSGWSAFQ